ncbi:MAG: calcium-binding protein, partial [Nocardioidaceae bacterium]
RRYWVETDDDGLCNSTAPAVWDKGDSEDAGAINSSAKFNPLDHVNAATGGGSTDDPDPTGASVADSDRLNFTVDERIDPTTVLECFYAYEADGDAHVGTDFDVLSNSASGATIQIDFDLNGESDHIVIAAMDDGAVGADDNGDNSTIGSFDLSDRLEAGFSDGPDLEQAFEAGSNEVTYCFDIDETLDPTDVDEGDFKVFPQSGNSAFYTGSSAGDIDGDIFVGVGPQNCATIRFVDDGPDAVDLAVAAWIGAGDSSAVFDRLPDADIDNRESGSDDGGNENPGAAGVKLGGPPPTGVAPPPTPPTPPGPTPPGIPTVRTGLCDPARTTAPLPELVIGGNGADLICGFGGDDTLRGLKGADTLKGGPGRDTGAGGKGKDTARGGTGNDVLRGSAGNDTLKGGGGKDTARGGRGNDLCRAETEKGCEA